MTMDLFIEIIAPVVLIISAIILWRAHKNGFLYETNAPDPMRHIIYMIDPDLFCDYYKGCKGCNGSLCGKWEK